MRSTGPRFKPLGATALALSLTLGGAWGSERSQERALTVERIYRPPSLSGRVPANVRWSPDGRWVTFLASSAGTEVMDLWGYDVARRERVLLLKAEALVSGEPRISPEEEALRERLRVTFTGITSYFWSPSGAHIFIPISGEFYLYEWATRRLARLLPRDLSRFDPQYSPDGRFIAYVKRNNLFLVDVSSGQERQLTFDGTEDVQNGVSEYVAQEEMDRFTGYWWSPDGRRIAYLQVDNRPVRDFHIPDYRSNSVEIERQKYPKAGDPNAIVRVGVLSLEEGRTVWMDTGPETDIYIPRVHWLPDGRTLSIQIQSRDQDRLSLYLFDATTGKGRLVLTEVEPGWVNLHDHLYFFKDGRHVLWSSERTGFRHLYLYDIEGRLVRQLTHGEWQVEALCGVDEARGVVYFTATEKSPLERHLYRVALDGTGLTRLSTEEGWHVITFSPTFEYYLDIYSNITTPPRLSLHRADGARVAYIEENVVEELQEYALGPVEFLTVRAEDGTPLPAMMIKPKGFDPRRRYPVIVYVYGGPRAQVVVNRWGGDRFLWHQLMAQRGFLIFSLDNRGSWGRGKAWELKIHRRLGYWEVKDQLAGVAYLKSLPYVDPQRIGIWGWSYGGYMTLMALFTAPEVFRTGIAVAPVTDWRNYDTHYTERYLERPQENPEGYRLSSPITYAAQVKVRFLLVHGMADDNVHVQDTVQLVDALIRARRPFDLMLYPGEKHGIRGPDARIHLFTLMTDYFLRHLASLKEGGS